MSKPKYCWDTSVFLAWLNREKSAPLADIDLLLDDFHAERAILVVSATTYTEILRAKHSAQQAEAFNRFLMRPNIVRVDVSFEIAGRGEQLRSEAITTAKKGQERNIRTPMRRSSRRPFCMALMRSIRWSLSITR